jgi:dephospho-CoA kinase/uncharacterized protein YkuJ
MKTEPKLFIAIAGKACAGKDTVANILWHFGFVVVNSADLVADENHEGGRAPTRENQHSLADVLRHQQGGDFWTRQAYAQGCEQLEKNGTDLLAIVGVYAPAEADFVLKNKNSLLVGVECESIRERHQRYLTRYSTDARRIMTFDEFVAADNRENSGTAPEDANVRTVLDMCKVSLNNDEDLESLRDQVYSIMQNLGIEPQDREVRNSNLIPSHENFDDLFRLEERATGLRFLRDYLALSSRDPSVRVLSPLLAEVHAVHHVSDEFARKLYGVFSQNELFEAYNDYLKLECHTTDEELACSLNQSQFTDCYQQLKQHLSSKNLQIQDQAIRNLRQIAKCDAIQFDRTVGPRSLEQMVKDGIRVEIKPGSDCETWLKALDLAGNGLIPVTELIKNERIVKTVRVPESKVSLVIHDAVDHLWFINLLDKRGIFNRYEIMMESIGNFTNCDIYKRESEMVASISFGTRSWTNYEIGYSPQFTVADIQRRFDKLFDDGELKDRHMDAFRHVRFLASQPHCREAQSLGFVFSNYITELDEQKRRFGKIKVLDSETYEITGELNPIGADYLSFFVDSHRTLHDRKNKHRDTLLRVHVLFEHHLANRSIAESGEGLSFHFNPLEWDDDILRRANETLPQQRLLWMARNYGFTAVREHLI